MGSDVQYLEAVHVLLCYAAIFGCTVEEAGDQLRSMEAIEGALARPQWYAQYAEADIPYQAAVLAHGIAETQPFIEGNKRTALCALLGFLEANDCTVTASQDDRFRWMVRLGTGATAEELAEWIRAALVTL